MRLRFFFQALILAAAVWAGVLASYVATPIALLVLPAFALALLGVARPAFVTTRRRLNLYVTISTALGLASVVWLFAYALYANRA